MSGDTVKVISVTTTVKFLTIGDLFFLQTLLLGAKAVIVDKLQLSKQVGTNKLLFI